MADVESLLGEMARSPQLRPFRELLESLASYDAERGSDLVHTLEVFFACGESVSEAADRLFLHRNSTLSPGPRSETPSRLNIEYFL